MTEQEITAELVRMAERYKMDEGRRRVRMVEPPQNAGNAQAIPETPQSGPDLDEYAYLGSPSPPVQGAQSMMPPESLSPRKIWPGSLEAGRRLGAVGGRLNADRPIPLPVPGQSFGMGDLPPGYSVDETNTVRDNDGNIPRTVTPSFGDMASYLAGGMQPGGAVGMAAKAVAGTAHGADMVLGVGPTFRGFNRSRLSEVPNVPQTDLPRYTPARGVPERTQEMINDPGVRAQMLETLERGQKMGGADWYNAEPLREEFLSTLGKREGEESFRKYMDFVAATSPRSKVPENVRNASYYYSLAKQGEPMPAIGTPNPAPYGHLAQKLHQGNAVAVAGAGWDPLKNPKPASFAQNLTGNQAPVTVDTHAFRLPAILRQDPRFLETAYQTAKDAPKQNIQAAVQSGKMPMQQAIETPAYWQAQPRENEYAALEQYYKGLGREIGLSPAQTQASAWVGGGKITGLASDESKPFVGFVEDRVRYTAQQRGLSEAEVLKRFIKGKEPLLALPVAAVPAVGALREDQK